MTTRSLSPSRSSNILAFVSNRVYRFVIDLGDVGLPYGRSTAIAERHESLLTLIRMGDRSAVALAQELGVSAATINRDVSYLRSKGHAITARRLAAGWAFAFEPSRDARTSVAGKRP